ncbi:TOMM precursor leader peptide-binding protein [Aquipuribacter sp. MA13-6]|uniref:TOMM precursor leader peptide-binding protein n=1 Tax=unclassified Aquipuribacter TaxID=2635084 RepID=UPI003EEC6BA1
MRTGDTEQSDQAGHHDETRQADPTRLVDPTRSTARGERQGRRRRGEDDVPVRWRVGLARTVRGPRSLQLGSGSDAVVLEGLTAADWRLLALLDRARSRPELDDAVAALGIPAARCERLLDVLARVGALCGAVGVRAREQLRPSLAGAQVAVVGGGGLGIVLTVALAAAGASRSALVDDASVGQADVLPGGAQHGDVGRRAAHVAAEAVHRLRPDVRTACPTDPDLVVLLSPHVPDAPAGIPLVQRGTVHLPVVVRPDEVVVGPLVVPGRGACLHCLDLHHRDLDPGWAEAVRLLRRDSGRVRQPGPAATAVVAGLVLVVAGAPQASSRAGVEVHVEDSGATRWRRWSAHPGCGCVGWPDPDPVGSAHPSDLRPEDPPAPPGGTGATMAA